MTQQDEILNGVEIVRNGKEIIAKIPLRLTEAKLEVEGGNDVGDALNKILCDAVVAQTNNNER